MVSKKVIFKSIDDAILKCSDGTGFSKGLNKSLDKFAKEYGGLDHEELSVYDKNGELINHYNGSSHSVEVDNEKLMSDGYTNLDVNHNHPTMWDDNLCTCLSEGDLLNLLDKNSDGEYLFRSVSAETPNGYRMSLIKNNKFNSDNEDGLKSLAHDLFGRYFKYVIDFKSEKQKTLQSMVKDDKYKGLLRSDKKEFERIASEKTVESFGSLESFLKKDGLYDDFKKVNCKLRITHQ